MNHRSRGEAVAWRSRPGGAIATVLPMTVVVDDERCTALYQATGCVRMKRTGVRGGPRGRTMLPGAATGHEPSVWNETSNVRLHVWGTAHSVIRTFDEGRFSGWYVNLEKPWVRTSVGFDSMDLVLDVTVVSDLGSCELKDEDELDWSVDAGLMSADEARLAREEAARVMRLIEDRAWPFVDDWSMFAPDAVWPVPVVPVGWDNR